MRLPLILAATFLPLAAHALEFQDGQFLMVSGSYDEVANRFSNDIPEGERTACFRVTAVRPTEIELSLVSGTFRPWWSDETYVAGTYDDTWFSSDNFLEQNPDADPLGELKSTFREVPSCPE